MKLTILYRGPLSSCNYDCSYCPFAKHRETTRELAADRRALRRFVDWIGARADHRFSVLFTPWGEALVRRWYQEALVELTRLDHIEKVAVQTNLSCSLDWLSRARVERLAFWATYHPSQVDRRRFLAQCKNLERFGARYSVGVVGMKEHAAEIGSLRRDLPPHVYLWINAYKRVRDYYSPADVEFLESIDPLFPINNTQHASLGHACRTGETVVSVDGDGTLRRCHFIAEPIGNLYEPNFEQALKPRPCTNATCGCHIGYVHLESLKLDEVFGEGILERVPANGSLTGP
jgi:MoaA/NifB/PqqE/SkfB family radical SAM enzyme